MVDTGEAEDEDEDEEFQGLSWIPVPLVVGSLGKGIRESGQSPEVPRTKP